MGPQGSSGSGTGSTANVYLPGNQAGADNSFWNMLSGLQQQYQQGNTPAQRATPFAFADFQRMNNPAGYGGALAGAREVSQLGGQFGQNELGYGNQIFQTGFDPQKALYNQLANQNLSQQNAINAMSGVGNTPYGAGVTGQNQQNFNMNWQNQQLARQQAAAQTGGALGQQGLQTISGSTAAPFNLEELKNQNALNALQQYVGIGQQQYQLPEALMNSDLQYMNMGQNASALSGQLGQMGVNQMYQGLGGIGSLLGLGSMGSGLFGGGGLLGLGNPLSGLFGSSGFQDLGSGDFNAWGR